MALARVEEVRDWWGIQPRDNKRASQQPAERGAVAIAQEEGVWRCTSGGGGGGGVGHAVAGEVVTTARVGEVRGRWGTQPREK